MDAYFEAKTKLFTGLLEQPKKKGKAVINLDDRYGAILVNRYSKEIPMITYGVGVHAEFRASNVRIDFNGTSYQLDAGGRSYLVRLPLIGQFNVYNSLAALAAASVMGVDVRTGVLALSNATAFVAADTSEAAPPITPATACARSASAITSIPGSRVRSTPSSVLMTSPFFARRARSSAPASFARSKACIG